MYSCSPSFGRKQLVRTERSEKGLWGWQESRKEYDFREGGYRSTGEDRTFTQDSEKTNDIQLEIVELDGQIDISILV